VGDEVHRGETAGAALAELDDARDAIARRQPVDRRQASRLRDEARSEVLDDMPASVRSGSRPDREHRGADREGRSS
jgi:hypothetical protein